MRRTKGLPTLSAATAFAIGIVNLVSALTPNIEWRGHLLLQVLPFRAIPIFHTLAVPASLALIVAALYLKRRRRRALQAAIALLVALGVLDILKGLDIEEAALSWGGAALLWWGRDSFVVRPGPLRRRVLAGFVGIVAFALAASCLLVWLASGRTTDPDEILRQALDLFAWTKGTVAFHDELSFVPLGVGLVTAFGIAVLGWILFRPLPPPCALPDDSERETAYRLVREFGRDTLAFFKLRRDLHYLFAAEKRAFLGYRIENDVLLVAGDPVGPPDALSTLVAKATAFAEVRDLKLAVLGASERLLPFWRDAGLRALYIGDEAIVETARFTLEGRAIRKVRQSVTRAERAGFSTELHCLGELGAATLSALEDVSCAWRGGAPERGFVMTMDTLGGERQEDSIVVVARAGDGSIKAFLHFVPTYGRSALSLSLMRRVHDTPNGLTEFLVARAIELLRERGVAELSLNFAAFGRFLERPGGRVERALGRVISLGNSYFQIESLYRFNAKFAPRWEPRYLLFETLMTLPRVGLAAMWAEGQLPRLRAS